MLEFPSSNQNPRGMPGHKTPGGLYAKGDVGWGPFDLPGFCLCPIWGRPGVQMAPVCLVTRQLQEKNTKRRFWGPVKLRSYRNPDLSCLLKRRTTGGHNPGWGGTPTELRRPLQQDTRVTKQRQLRYAPAPPTATCALICEVTPRRRNVNSTDFYCDGNKRVRVLGRPVLPYRLCLCLLLMVGSWVESKGGRPCRCLLLGYSDRI